ncbi:dynein heavy chain [Rhizoclosmatium globosum]|uniref:Dynein heavy chain, cytoplasmic n=1 Tax=Rhizoclosmatium globosum TaxID=329046 RepID=A0A1Y2BTR7_9FUNG|nr:dynein heavy chain [Rhizoclosmatium globosum]|eukprot:ORY38141.1 dynein heavy chain [Rhizoclosmatium globosum]
MGDTSILTEGLSTTSLLDFDAGATVTALRTHLAQRLLPALLCVEASSTELELQSTANEAVLTAFSTDPSVLAMYVSVESGLGAGAGDEGVTLTLEATTSSSVAVLKRSASVPLDAQSAFGLANQLSIVALPGLAAASSSLSLSSSADQQNSAANPKAAAKVFEALHGLVHAAVAPFFDAFVAASNNNNNASDSSNKDKDNNAAIPKTKKKMAELELSLLHLQQNVEIPEVHLSAHPLIQRAIAKCKENSTRVTVDAVGDITEDSTFLNKLQSDVNGWIKEIQKVTRLSRDPDVLSGTARQEINFWLNMDNALAQIEDQLKGEQVVLTLDVLKHAKRFHATVSFRADTGLNEALDKVNKYNQLMKDFPLNELLSSTDIERAGYALTLIFGHLNKKLRISPYPIERALKLVEAISRDFNDQLVKFIGGRRLMLLPYEEFDKVTGGAFRVWDDNVKEFTNVAREQTRKRQEQFMAIRIHSAHADLKERVGLIRAFRFKHEQLYNTIVKVMKPSKADANAQADKFATILSSDSSAIEDVNLAYDCVKSIDVLDVSPEGKDVWIEAINNYNDLISRVENQIISRLRDSLGSAKNANEMFRVFSKFNDLFVHPKIRGAIQEYQTQLIESVKADILGLHDKFKVQYRNSEASHLSLVRDIPPVSAGIYMSKVEDILGKDWMHYIEGQKLYNESASFKRKLDTKVMFENWVAEINKRDLTVSGRIFDISRVRAANNSLQLKVNFDAQIITLFKEVRNLLWMNFRVPITVANVAKDAKRIYPFAVSLNETVRTYTQTVNKIDKHESIGMLVAGYRKEVQSHIAKGIQLRWDYFVNTYDSRPFMSTGDSPNKENRHVSFVRTFASIVSNFQEKVNTAIVIYEDINLTVEELRNCPFNGDAFMKCLQKIQKSLDTLNLGAYSNLDLWTQDLNLRIEQALTFRLQGAIRAWMYEFTHQANESSLTTDGQRKQRGRRGTLIAVPVARPAIKDDKKDEMKPTIKSFVLEIRLRNQVMFLDPPLEHARANWYSQFHEWIGIICDLPRVKSSSYEISYDIAEVNAAEETYKSLLAKLPQASLTNVYDAVEQKVSLVKDYVSKWLQYQSLWDLQTDSIYNAIGDDLAKWHQLVLEIKKARTTFDNSETEKAFGSVVIDYDQVQSKVNAKYDQWQKEILTKFGLNLSSSMKNFYSKLAKARTELEMQSVEGTSTAQAVGFITFVQELKKKLVEWGEDVEVFKQSQKVLEKQRFVFPNDWLWVENVEGEWNSFNDILKRKNLVIQEQMAAFQSKIVLEDQAVAKKVGEILQEWEKSKPIQGDIPYDVATNSLSIFEGRVARLMEETETLNKAKESMDLELFADNRLIPVMEELKDLKAVWIALSGIWKSYAEVKETAWAAIAPRKLKQSIDQLLADMKELPSKMRSYAAFDYLQEMLKGLLKNMTILTDLKSEALRERHWKLLLKALGLEKLMLAELTVGHLWDADIKKHERALKEIVVDAQGEMALEEFMKQVREVWNSYELELLFAKCSEHLNSLTAMKNSLYYKAFEEEASAIHVLFDVWVDVQRQWVYLEGIFNGNADIAQMLPLESMKFQNINAEFMTVMKKVQKDHFVLKVLTLDNILKVMERILEQLTKIQKALGEYLERQRSAFPRFYFVGDEDLLEIIGNSKEVGHIQKHFKKMFPGISTIQLTEDESKIVAIASHEGEIVTLKKAVSIKDNPKINEWLTLLESEMKVSLAVWLTEAVGALNGFYYLTELSTDSFTAWLEKYPAQLIVLSAQIVWTASVEECMADGGDLDRSLSLVNRTLAVLADMVLTDLPAIRRRKCEHLITELVHQRDVVRDLVQKGVKGKKDFSWLYHMRFYLTANTEKPLEALQIRMADSTFLYGFEYLGIPDRLVQTPLTDRCYLTMTQALASRLGGSPFGPAGTGKTESVKALAVQLGRFCLVFCCDETFDFQAMGRIFIGLSQVGAWGCFDEFNRLEERILSAVSQQVQTIQLGLKDGSEVEVVNKVVKVNPNTGIFITMNPGYAGRSNLPDNLKKLFRSIAMTHPDRELIAQVMLFSQGFRTAEALATKAVPLFNLCAEQLSAQAHYDFGLRSLKSVLVSAGNLKRDRLNALRVALSSGDAGVVAKAQEELSQISSDKAEQEIIIQSVRETVAPKLVADDVPLLHSLIKDVFPGIDYVPVDLNKLKDAIKRVCKRKKLVDGGMWMEKVIQLYQIQNIHHGLMMVGPSGSGKSTAWRVLLEALEIVEGVEGASYLIDPKAISKEDLYGTLDATTREWTDGLFTHILRKIVDNVRGENTKRHWIIFDGDVDPVWIENLNSVLDDNKLLTLPNGERLALPKNVRIMFEVETLKYATLATVSRCGMIWFSEDVISLHMVFSHYFERLKNVSLEDGEEMGATEEDEEQIPFHLFDDTVKEVPANILTQRQVAEAIHTHFRENGLVQRALEYSETLDHIMDFTRMRVLNTLFSLINKTTVNVLDYNSSHPDFPLAVDLLEKYVSKRLLLAVIWSFSGDCKLDLRAKMGEFLRTASSIEMPSQGGVIDYDVNIITGDWVGWHTKVPVIEIESQSVSAADVVIPTIDTIRHEEVLYSWLSEHKPLLLCGPPGSGKTMTLFAALRKLPSMEVVGLNFSSATTPELIIKTFEQHCEYRKTPNGVILSPQVVGRWLVLFCDEINLPAADKYGTQRVISFLRQLVQHGGYWRPSDKTWVKLERIQFVGACNPPTDPGRVPLSHRFLSHAPLIMVDYPGEVSLNQIYNTFSRATLKLTPNLRGYADALTGAMVEFFLESQKRFTADIQAHYIYSPRELTRWIRGIFKALKASDSVTVEDLLRIWAHEGLRLFSDRLVQDDEREWTDRLIDDVAAKHFPNVDLSKTLQRPILFSNWISKNYQMVERDVLRDFVKARLKVFYEEELDVPLVLFNDVLDHVLRIDRVFKQMQGHLLLIGVSGSGKTTLSRFVAWMNGLSVFQIKVHNKYTADDFDDDLRNVLRRAGTKGEKICFIMDESNVLDAGFLERMNTLLANAEIPGLFEGDEHTALMAACREGAIREGAMVDSADDLYKWFTLQVMKNLHIVFTMNPPEGGLSSRAATSPALFNRCVLDWFGDWSDQAFYQVGKEFTDTLSLDDFNYSPPSSFPVVYHELPLPLTYRSAVMNAFVFVHKSLYEVNAKLGRTQGRYNHVTPRHYLDFINHYVKLFTEKCSDLEEQQKHINVGLDKMKDTVIKVEDLRKSLAIKKTELEAKNAMANEKLQKMVTGQQEAEQQKAVALKMQEEIAKQAIQIEERSTIVKNDLALAEPAVLEAQQSVSSIKKQHLTEMRSMGNPPETVKMALEAVCILLGTKIDSWKSVQAVIKKDDFIANIVKFNTDKVTKRIRDEITKNYMSNPNFNYETVNHASKACGPLVQWVIAQVKYSNILDSIGPLRAEVQQLEEGSAKSKVKAAETEAAIAELEVNIAAYKDEYAVLISETQALKSEMEKVKSRVDRSLALLENLSSENDRWTESSQSFDAEMSTIVGDVLLSSAFIAYGGFFDQQYREMLINKWVHHLNDSGVRIKTNLSISEYLSNADERALWQERSLPADDLCTENAIMLNRFNRYPLIIDPAGQAINFLKNSFKDRKLTVTSFLDDSFLKVLESALRFGNVLLVQDVENLDPILNAVLNKELRRTGGRVLIKLGGQEIDFSPQFKLFLSTRNPSVNFSPDICSRVTFVNFTVTRGSLQAQCLHQVLKAERPDTDRKRTDLIKARGEFQLRLRHLEKLLLQALNESRGNILDDDKVMETLETLKKEAAEITKKVEDTDIVLQEVEEVTATYTPLAQACSNIFFLLENLNQLHYFYQFSLDFFNQIFEFVLHKNPALQGVTDYNQRLSIIMKALFSISYSRASKSLLHDDQVIFGVLISRIKVKNSLDQIDDDEYDFFLLGGQRGAKTSFAVPQSVAKMLGDELVMKAQNAASTLPAFKELINHITANEAQWKAFMNDKTAEEAIPECWASSQSQAVVVLRKLIVVKLFRPDRLIATAAGLVEAVFGAGIQQELNLQTIVQDEISFNTPVALCSVPGYDASNRVENLAKESSVKLTSVAMGSQEGFVLAENAISAATRDGSWVLLKNVHLSPSWLSQLEKRLLSLKANKTFRLFLTTETNPSVPVNLLRLSRTLMFEPPPGIKANLQESLSGIPKARLARGPAERTRLYFLAAWLHAVIQERLRYVPLGWTKSYEFNDSDFEMCLVIIDNWIDDVASGRSNIAPEKIPWNAVKTLLRETVYGGKIDNVHDQALLDSFVNALFRPASYDHKFALVSSSAAGEDGGKGQALLIPDETKMDKVLAWVSKLPDQQPPTWLGLPANAEKVLKSLKGKEMLQKLRKIYISAGEDETIVDEVASSKASDKQQLQVQPSWMRSVNKLVGEWLAILPASVPTSLKPSTGTKTKDPLYRFFERENQTGVSLLKTVRNDFVALQDLIAGKIKQTNHLRALVDWILKGMVPPHWKKHKSPESMPLEAWIQDLASRLAQLTQIAQTEPSQLRSTPVWLGGLFVPHGYVTATMQEVAHRENWSLDELKLAVVVGEDANGFALTGVRIEGGEFKNGVLNLSHQVSTQVDLLTLVWQRKSTTTPTPKSPGRGNQKDPVQLGVPVYLNSDRKDVLFVADLKVKNGGLAQVAVQQGVALVSC